jgi:hypothetical protein
MAHFVQEEGATEMCQRLRRLLSPLLMSAAVCLLVGAPPAVLANGVVTEFVAFDVACKIIEGDGDLNVEGIVLSEESRMAGTSIIELTFLENGQLLVDATYFPTAVSGSWIAPGQGQTKSQAPVHHNGSGTGELAGARIVFTATEAEEPVANPCEGEPVLAAVKLVGRIIDPPGR